ncbi:MAG: biopolymer transporter ExbD [Gammaproteobacteria bacterium]|nr:biopolymer transporter ExbD [Gammaproteobacteria bacterium]MDH3466612.1 biopolymer transporter ExbD [Gammaproteobacteria bacterium]
MRFKEQDDEELQINLTPLIDVVFLLLIFFMVSTTFSKESQFHIKLPEATNEPTEQKDNLLEIEINSEGDFAVKGPREDVAKRLVNRSAETLTAALKTAAAGDPDLIIVIRADRRTPHEAVVNAMDMSRRLGYLNITFSTRNRSAPTDAQ